MNPGRSRTALLIAGLFALTTILTLLAYRDGRRLTFDGYHYCELAKQFTAEWPDRFGNHWPFGYPLAGALLARCGLPAFESLVLVSAGTLLALLATATLILGPHPWRGLVLAALAAAPVLPIQLGGILTELPFATCLLGLVACLARWPARWALWGAAGCTVLALAVRYAGIIACAALPVWLLWRWRTLRTAGRLAAALAATGAALLICTGLLALNFARSGYASGAGRGGAAGLAALPHELANFGWSAPSALLAGGIRDRLGAGTPTGAFLGGLVFAAFAALCMRAWLRPRSPFSQPLALVALGYATGMGVLHCVGDFDALYNARTFLPVLFPVGLLTAELFPTRRAVLSVACAVLLFAGATAALRGISREIGGEIRAAVAPSRARLQPGDLIAINDHAFSLSAYVPQRTIRVWPEYWQPDVSAPLLVIAAQPSARDGSGGTISTEWTRRSAGAVAEGTHAYLVNTPELLVLARQPAPDAAPTAAPSHR